MKKIEKQDDQKKSTYTRSPIPREIVVELEEMLGCDDLMKLAGPKFQAALLRINERVFLNFKTNPSYAAFFRPDDNQKFIDSKSLKRYFNGSTIRKDKLDVLRCFLDHAPEKLLTEEIKVQKAADENIYDGLLGPWYSYIYDESETTSNKIKRTVLFIKRRNAYFLDVEFEGLSGRFTGTAEVLNNALVITLLSTDKRVRIFLCAELPELGNFKYSRDLILNVGCLSNSLSGRPVFSNVIMIKNNAVEISLDDEEAIRGYLKTKPVTLIYQAGHSTVHSHVQLCEANTQEQEIIAYLHRNKNRNSRLNAFLPNSFDQVKYRNALAYRKNGNENYERLKIKLNNHRFYAFNRFRQRLVEVAVFSYTFQFVDEEKRCLVVRHPINNFSKTEFSGEVFLEAEMMTMVMRDGMGQRRKQLIAPFNCQVNENSGVYVFKGITSSISTLNKNPMALRELIVCIPNNEEDLLSRDHLRDEDKINGFISYKTFRELPKSILKTEEKLFLANQSMSILTFPNKSDTTYIYYRLDKARKYEGEYYLFTYNSDIGNQPLHMDLSIDSLSEVILKIKYTDSTDDETNIYNGVCEYYNNSLRIGAHYSSEYPNDEKHSEFICNPIREKDRQLPQIFTGKNLTTSDGNKAIASSFIAIKKGWLQEKQKEIRKLSKESIMCDDLETPGTVKIEELGILKALVEKHVPEVDIKDLSEFLLENSRQTSNRGK